MCLRYAGKLTRFLQKIDDEDDHGKNEHVKFVGLLGRLFSGCGFG